MTRRDSGPDAAQSPPRLGRRLLVMLLGRSTAADIDPALEQLFQSRVARSGVHAARLWYWRQVAGFVLRAFSLRRDMRDAQNAAGPRNRALVAKSGSLTWAAVVWLRGFKHAFRSVARHPGFAALAITALGLGIGANTAMFTVLYSVVLEPLPYRNPESLVMVWPETVSNMRMLDWLSENTRSFDGISGFSSAEFALTGGAEAERVAGARVSTNHFEVLGVRPVLGRSFRREESEPGRSRVVVLSHGLWESRYGGDDDIVGRTIQIDYAPYTVIGVMPRHYRALDPSYRLWIPQPVEPGTTVGTDETWWVRSRIARLAPGAAVAAAQRDLRAAAVRLAEEFPTDLDKQDAARASVSELRSALVGDFGRTLWILLAAVGLVLLIACTNVANLLLARAQAKQRDVAIRTAIGASRGQLAVHLISESLVLGLFGGATGLLLGWITLLVLQATAPSDLPRIAEVRVDRVVLMFTIGLSLLTPLIFGVLPAYRATRLDVREVLASGGRGSVGEAGTARLAATLIVAEVAISVVLVIGAALMMRSLWNLRAVDPGFRTENILTFHVSVPPAAGEPAGGPDMTLYRQLWDALRAIRGVEAVGAIHILPLTSGNNRYPFWAQDNEPAADARAPAANIRVATPGYLDALGIDLLAGRWFSDSDRMDGPPVLVINERLARRLWPDASPIGKRIRLLDAESFDWEVVGVIRDVKQMALAQDPSGEIYLPHEQWSWQTMFVTMRARDEATALAPVVRRAVAEVSGDITISKVATMEQVAMASLASQQFLSGLTSAFALLALLLSAIGVYGVMSYTVSRRVPEFGVRLALGSSRVGIVKTAMVRALLPVAFGVLLGLGVAWITTRVLSTLLFGVEPADPTTYGVVASALLVVAAAAAYLPAHRATLVDPTRALRME